MHATHTSTLSQPPGSVVVTVAGFLLAAIAGCASEVDAPPHNSTGTTPGLGIIRVNEDGRDGALAAVVPLSNVRDGENVADPHVVRVRTPR